METLASECEIAWLQEEMYKNSKVPDCMSRKEFEVLLRMFQFANKYHQRLHKIQPIVNRLSAITRTRTKEGKQSASLLPFRVHQYLKNRRHRYGTKRFKQETGILKILKIPRKKT